MRRHGPSGGKGRDERSARTPAVAAPQAVSPERGKKLTGTIESLDAAAGTFSEKATKEAVQLKAGEKVQLGDFKLGDKVKDTASQIATAKKIEKKKAKEPARK